jgi:hypothetical protein
MMDHLSLNRSCAAAEFVLTNNQAGIVAIATMFIRGRMINLTRNEKHENNAGL